MIITIMIVVVTDRKNNKKNVSRKSIKIKIEYTWSVGRTI